MADPFFSNVKFLCHFNGTNGSTTFTDVIGHTMTPSGAAQISTAQSLFGGASGSHSGVSGYVSVADSADLELGSSDFTLEVAIRGGTLNSGAKAVFKGPDGGFWPWNIRHFGTWLFYASSNGSSHDIANGVSFGAFSDAAFIRLAVTRSGNTWRMYYEGTKVQEFVNASSVQNTTDAMKIGGIAGADQGACHVDEMRITIGVARYTGASYTLDTGPFPDSGPVLPGVGNIVIAGKTPLAYSPIYRVPTQGAIAVAGKSPLLAIGVNKLIGVGAIALLGRSPTLAFTANHNRTPGLGAITLLGRAPIINVTNSRTIIPGVGAIILLGKTPTVALGVYGQLFMERFDADGSATGSASAALEMELFTADANASSGSIAYGAVTLEELIVLGAGPSVNAAVMQKITAAGTALSGGLATGALQLDQMSTASVAGGVGIAYGDITLQTLIASAAASQSTVAAGAVTLRRIQAAGRAVSGTVAFGSLELKELDSAGTAAPVSVSTGAMALQPLFVAGFSEPVIAQTYRTWVMNTANEALSEYTNSSFNSYANFNDKHYAAGPSGLFEVSGDNDNGTNIGWAVRTGLHDDKNGNLKGLAEILMSVRFNGPIRIKVWTDDTTVYEYTLINFRNDVLHQVRVPTGKGMRSRFYRVELSGMNGAACELEALQLPMEPVKRRVG